MSNNRQLFVRLGESERPSVQILIDGRAVDCLVGDTVLTAMLLHGKRVRFSEFGDGPRAGFCNMGACQDCWVDLDGGERMRACTTYVRQGMKITTEESL